VLANDAQRLVLWDFSWRSNADGLLWPSIAVVAMDLGKSPRAVRRAIREMVDEQIMNADADFRNDGSQGSNYYQLLLAVTPEDLLKLRKERLNGRPIMSTSRKRFDARMERFYKFLGCWGQTLSAIRNEVDRHTFNTWYAPLQFRGINKRSLILGMPNENFQNYFRDRRSKNIILNCAKRCFTIDLIGVYFNFQK
jgi:hypothetical protein